MIYLSKNMDFHSYVKLPEGSAGRWSWKTLWLQDWFWHSQGQSLVLKIGIPCYPQIQLINAYFPIQIVILGYTAYPIKKYPTMLNLLIPLPLARGVGQNDLEPTKKTQKNMVIQMIVMIV